jgi:hypothetical protein
MLFIFPLLFLLSCIAIYPMLMIYLLLPLNLGVWTWLLFTVMISPFVVVWYVVVSWRIRNYMLLLLDSKTRKWDIPSQIRDYIEYLHQKPQLRERHS